jgi:O-acetylhomoserine/O-acetylserine sulfhydrylase-like pyridoxal-dependent enzyme
LFILLIVNSFFLGEEIVAGDDLYGGSDRLLSKIIPKKGIVVKLVLLSL